jgi:Protein of unknown function (DUF1203)
MIADQSPAFPCRVSLQDAAEGETVILLHYEHQRADSPFRASHAIYVRPAPAKRIPRGEVPKMLRSRLLSVRAFDDRGMLEEADVVEGAALEPIIERMLRNPKVAYLHIHFARPGCYAARVDRTWRPEPLPRAASLGRAAPAGRSRSARAATARAAPEGRPTPCPPPARAAPGSRR